MKRVLLIGSGGSGKTTVARRLAEVTGLPLIHLDSIYWGPGWQSTPAAEWEATVRKLIDEDRWIMDGNYGGTLEIRLAACDTVVFLDLPRLTCLWRVLRRQVHHLGRSRPELPAGCRERLSWEFLAWIWNYPASRRPGILARLGELDRSKRAVVLRSQTAVDEFLATSISGTRRLRDRPSTD